MPARPIAAFVTAACLTAACLTAACLTAAAPALAGKYSALYAFGDSLSDAGNIWAASGHVTPAAPYNQGRYSNGNVWVQDLSVSLGLGPLAPSLTGGTDFAFGGAETGQTASHTVSPLDLPAQLAEFAAAVKFKAPSRALYTLSIGGNDLLDVIGAGAALEGKKVTQAANNAALFLGGLAAMGARHFLILNVPDLGHVPVVSAGGAAAAADGTALAQAFNAALSSRLGVISLLYGARFSIVDSFTLIDQVEANPAPLGFTNATDPCWTGDEYSLSSGTLCATDAAAQDAWLFWDTVHPTENGHAVLAARALSQLP